MKKKITLISLAVVALLLVGLLSSLAFLTDEKDVTNTFTVGNVEIELDEPNYPEGQPHKLLPGTEIAKDPTVTLLGGSEEAYIFMQIIYEGGIETVLEAIEIGANWLPVADTDDLYVYSSDETDPTPVEAAVGGTELPALFTTIVVDDELGNDAFEDLAPKLTIRAFAHQALVNGSEDYPTAVAKAKDWATPDTP